MKKGSIDNKGQQDSKASSAKAKAEYYKIVNNQDFVASIEEMQSQDMTTRLGLVPEVDFDALMPFTLLREGTAEQQYAVLQKHVAFIKKYNLRNHILFNNLMEKSIDYFNDVLDKMLLLDYDIFRISLIMYRNFDFKNAKESSVQLTKMLYQNHGETIDLMTNNMSKKELKWRKKYPVN